MSKLHRAANLYLYLIYVNKGLGPVMLVRIFLELRQVTQRKAKVIGDLLVRSGS